MSRNHFSALLVAVVVVVVAIALLVPKKTADEQAEPEAVLLEGVEERINEASRVEVVTAGNELAVTLERGEENWTISELGGYPADWPMVRELLADLAQARVIEVKTDNPDYHDRLGVEDVSSEEAAGVLVRVSIGADTFGVIIGNMADSREGRYVRLADAAQSVLVDFDAQVPKTPSSWADEVIADIPSSEVNEVEILHPDGERVLVTKPSADATDFELHELPEGREPQSSWSVNALGGVLASLRMESVQPAVDVEWTDPVRLRVLTFDGLEVTVEAVETDEEHWIRLDAAATPVVAAGSGEETSAEEDERSRADSDEAETDKEPPPATEPDEEAGGDFDSIAARAESLNERVAGWAYRIPQYKFDTLTKRTEDLLKPLDEDGEG